MDRRERMKREGRGENWMKGNQGESTLQTAPNRRPRAQGAVGGVELKGGVKDE